MPIEIQFLFKYINIVKEKGYICIILPYGFLSLDSVIVKVVVSKT